MKITCDLPLYLLQKGKECNGVVYSHFYWKVRILSTYSGQKTTFSLALKKHGYIKIALGVSRNNLSISVA